MTIRNHPAARSDQRVSGVRILLVEDDESAAQFILKGLKEHGYVADHALDGKDGLFLAASEKYDALIIDRVLPGLDGLSIVKMLRAAGGKAPACRDLLRGSSGAAH